MGLLDQPIEPFHLQRPHPAGRSFFLASPYIKAAAHPHPQAAAALAEPAAPGFLARDTEGNQHQIRLGGQQLGLQLGPLARVLVAMGAEHQPQPRALLGQADHQLLHHHRRAAHQGHPPALGGGVAQ